MTVLATSVPQTALEQSRIPHWKLLLLHKHALSVAEQPREGAKAIMLFMQVCWRVSARVLRGREFMRNVHRVAMLKWNESGKRGREDIENMDWKTRTRMESYTALWEAADITLSRNGSDESAEDEDGLHFGRIYGVN